MKYLPPSFKRRLAWYRARQCTGKPITAKWMVAARLARTLHSARQMLFLDCKCHILRSIRTFGFTFYELAEIAEQKARRMYVTCSNAAGYARPGGTNRDQHDYLKTDKNKTEFGKVCISNKHSLHDLRHRQHAVQLQQHQREDSQVIRDNSAYSAANPHCRCRQYWICGWCRSLPTLPVTAASLAAPRHLGHGIWGKAWADSHRAVFDALDRLPGCSAKVHRLYFEFIDPRSSERAKHFDQLGGNKRIDADIVVEFNGAEIRAHVERYKGGMVIIKANLTDLPIQPEQVPDFKRTLAKALPPEIQADSPPETWRTVGTDLGYDLETAETCRRSHTETYKHHVLHAYNKTLKSGKRVLRLEAQINPGTDNDIDYFAVLERARAVLLESCNSAR